MNVLQLQVMLHHFYNPEPITPRTEQVATSEKRLVADGLIELLHPAPQPYMYRTTKRGRAYVLAVLNVPLPPKGEDR